MDRVGARNTLIVLLTVVSLTLASFTVLLILVLRKDPVPDLLQGICTLLLGTLTGSAVTLGAQPKVPQRVGPDAVPLLINATGDAIDDISYADDELGAQVGDVDTEQISHQLAHSPANGPDEPAAEDDPQPQPPAGEY